MHSPLNDQNLPSLPETFCQLSQHYVTDLLSKVLSVGNGKTHARLMEIYKTKGDQEALKKPCKETELLKNLAIDKR